MRFGRKKLGGRRRLTAMVVATAATIGLVMAKWPQVKILTTAKSVVFLQQFGYPAAAAAAEAVKKATAAALAGTR